MRRPAPELLFAAIALVGITLWYGYQPADKCKPSGLLGHGLGIVGFLLMLSAETLYTLRKRLRGFPRGQMSTWLQWHVFSGIVGAYLVLLHSAGKFNGLAGLLTLLTIIMVISGFVGRFIYTAVPRTLDGVEVAARELEERIAGTNRQLHALGLPLWGTPALGVAADLPASGWQLVLGRTWLRWQQQRRLRRALRNLQVVSRPKSAQLQQLLVERYRLQLQVNSLAATRDLLALWHLFHVPLGVVLFTLAFIHIGAALFYATWWQ